MNAMHTKLISMPRSLAMAILFPYFLAVAPAGADSVISLPITSCTVTKGMGRLAVPIQRTNELSSGASVNVATADFTAKAGVDYIETNAILTFQAGVTQRFIYIPILNDGTTNNNKVFNLLLSSPTEGATLGSRKSLRVVIANNNKGLHFYVPAVSIKEEEGLVVIKVARGDSVDRRVSVDYATTNGTAKAGQDYTATAGTLSFEPGEVLKSFTVPILNDSLPETAKTFQIGLSNPTGGAVLSSPVTQLPSVTAPAISSIMTVTINDTDRMVQFEFPKYSIREESQYIQIGVIRGENDSDAAIDFVSNDKTAFAGRDYIGTTNTIRFAAGERWKSIQVAILNNNAKDLTRSFSLQLSNPIGGATLGVNKSASVNIIDDDPGLGFSKGKYVVPYNAAEVNIPVIRGGGEPTNSFTVDFKTMDGAGKAGVDYQAFAGTLRFEPYEVVHNITVPILPTVLKSNTKSFRLMLSNPSDGMVISGTGALTVVNILHPNTEQASWPIIPPIDTKLTLRSEEGVNTLSWDNEGLLRHADQVNGAWEDVTGAGSPYTTSPASAAGFYQLQSARPTAIYVPSSYDPQTPMPLILALHYYGGAGEAFRYEFNFVNISEKKGCLICFPQGISAVNASGTGFTWNGPEFLKFSYVNSDDSGYLRSVIEETRRQFTVDPKRICVIGFSAGGMMAHRLAYENADLISGIVSLAGATTYDPKNCHPTHPVNVLEIHGTADTVVPYNGGYLNGGEIVLPTVGEMPGAVRTAQIWAELNGCKIPVMDAEPTITTTVIPPITSTPNICVMRYTQCPPGGEVELWTISGADHYVFSLCNDYFYTPIVEWLMAHPKP